MSSQNSSKHARSSLALHQDWSPEKQSGQFSFGLSECFVHLSFVITFCVWKRIKSYQLDSLPIASILCSL
jgi:hypothetical protein